MLQKELRLQLRLLCGFRRGSAQPWNVVIRVHPENPALQPQISKVDFKSQAGYAAKQKHESANFQCAPQLGPCQ